MFKNIFIGKFKYKFNIENMYLHLENISTHNNKHNEKEGIYGVKNKGDFFCFKYYYITNSNSNICDENNNICKNIFYKEEYSLNIYYNQNNICIYGNEFKYINEVFRFLSKKLDLDINFSHELLEYSNIIKKLRGHRLYFNISNLSFKNVKIAGIRTKQLNIDVYDNNDAYQLIDKIKQEIDTYKINIIDNNENEVSIKVEKHNGHININYEVLYEDILCRLQDVIQELLYEGD